MKLSLHVECPLQTWAVPSHFPFLLSVSLGMNLLVCLGLDSSTWETEVPDLPVLEFTESDPGVHGLSNYEVMAGTQESFILCP